MKIWRGFSMRPPQEIRRDRRTVHRIVPCDLTQVLLDAVRLDACRLSRLHLFFDRADAVKRLHIIEDAFIEERVLRDPRVFPVDALLVIEAAAEPHEHEEQPDGKDEPARRKASFPMSFDARQRERAELQEAAQQQKEDRRQKGSGGYTPHRAVLLDHRPKDGGTVILQAMQDLHAEPRMEFAIVRIARHEEHGEQKACERAECEAQARP